MDSWMADGRMDGGWGRDGHIGGQMGSSRVGKWARVNGYGGWVNE